MVSANRTTCLPSARAVREISGPLLMATNGSSTTNATEKVAFNSGSSQHGNARRASVACIWVVAMTDWLPSSSVKVTGRGYRRSSSDVPARARGAGYLSQVPSSKPLDVVGIGNALVDVITTQSDAFLDQCTLTKGAMMLIDTDRAVSLYSAMGP